MKSSGCCWLAEGISQRLLAVFLTSFLGFLMYCLSELKEKSVALFLYVKLGFLFRSA